MSDCGLVGSEYNSAPIKRPILRGRDIKRYGYEWAGLYLIATFPSKNYNIEDYPAIRDYLLSFGKERLEQTGATYIVDGKPIKSRKATNNQWFETQDSISYSEDFLKPKIIYSEIVQSPQFYLDQNEHFLAEATAFILCGEHLEYLVKLLNSKTLAFIFKKYYAGGGLGEKGYRYKKAFLENLPIPKYQENELCRAILDNENEEVEQYITALYGFSEEEKALILV